MIRAGDAMHGVLGSDACDNLERLAGLLNEVNARQLGLDEFDPNELPGDPRDAHSLASGGNFRTETDRTSRISWRCKRSRTERRAQPMSTGVPSGTRLYSAMTSPTCMRMQPCDAREPIE